MADALGLRLFSDYGFVIPGGATNFVVDASNEGVAWAFQPRSADPITHLGYRYGARTGTPPVYSIALEQLDTGGLPDGTDIGGGSPTLVTFTPPADTTIDGLWQWKTLTNPYTPTVGQMLAAVIRYSSGTIDGSNNSSFTRSVAATFASASRGFPYPLTNSAGTWSRVSSIASFGYRTASGRYGRIYQSNYTTATANTATHKSGMHFTLPSGHGSTFQILGLSLVGKLGAATGSYKLGVWSTDGTERAITATIDADHSGQTPGSGDVGCPIFFSNSSPYDFSYGTKYYCGIEVVSGTVGINGIVLAEAADRSSFPNGTNRGLVTWNGSVWTETDTVMPLCELILKDITVPSGGGSAYVIGS